MSSLEFENATSNLRGTETAKLLCAKKLFETMNNGNVHYGIADSYQSLMDIMNK